MGVKSEEEGNKQVMCVPESLEGLLTDFCVCGRVHKKHAEKHDMSCNTTGFGVVDLDSCDLSNLSLLDIEEAEVVSLVLKRESE